MVVTIVISDLQFERRSQTSVSKGNIKIKCRGQFVSDFAIRNCRRISPRRNRLLRQSSTGMPGGRNHMPKRLFCCRFVRRTSPF
jgi:hypothetical protein